MRIDVGVAHPDNLGPCVSLRVQNEATGELTRVFMPPDIAVNISDGLAMNASLVMVLLQLKEFLVSDMEIHPNRADELVKKFSNRAIEDYVKGMNGDEDGS